MIVRIWHGRVPAEKAASVHGIHCKRRAIHRLSLGRREPERAACLRRQEGEVTHFITLTFWDSAEAIKAFAGTISRPPSTIRRTRNSCWNSSTGRALMKRGSVMHLARSQIEQESGRQALPKIHRMGAAQAKGGTHE